MSLADKLPNVPAGYTRLKFHRGVPLIAKEDGTQPLWFVNGDWEVPPHGLRAAWFPPFSQCNEEPFRIVACGWFPNDLHEIS